MATPQRSRFWTLQIGGWSIFFAAMFLAGIGLWPLDYTFIRKSSLAIIGFALTSLMRYPYRAVRTRRASAAVIAIAGITLSIVAAGIWMAIHNVVMKGWRDFPDFTNTIYYAFLLVAWTALYFGESARDRLGKVEALAQHAQVRALRLQLNPHFLFNSLNAVSTLIAEGRNAEANRMLSRLSDFLRTTLDAADSDEIRVGDEIDFARRYLDVEKTRFGDRLHIRIDVADDASSALVPPMILQPIVENAIKHAIVPRERGGNVAITATRDRDWLKLGVDDDGPGFDATTSNGIGLANVRDRLSEIYGDRSSLDFSRNEQGGLAVSIRVPYRLAATP